MDGKVETGTSGKSLKIYIKEKAREYIFRAFFFKKKPPEGGRGVTHISYCTPFIERALVLLSKAKLVEGGLPGYSFG